MIQLSDVMKHCAAKPRRGEIGVLAPFLYASVTLRDAERPAILMAGV